MNTDTRLANFHFSFVLYTLISIFLSIYFPIMLVALIDPSREVQSSSFWQEAKKLMIRYCALIHWVEVTPFPPINELLEAIQWKIVQIIYIYHGNNENSPRVYSQSDDPIWKDRVKDMDDPSFYWLVQHHDGSTSIACLLRKPWFIDVPMLQGMIDHFHNLSRIIESNRRYSAWSIIFSWVGILPWWINRLAQAKWKNSSRLSVPESVIAHNNMKNENSARFVSEAWRQILIWEFDHQWCVNQVILGHDGNLWKAVLAKLNIDAAMNTSGIHLLDDTKNRAIPEFSVGHLLILDLTHWSLKNYLESLIQYRINHPNSKIVWVNEAYPPPTREIIQEIAWIWIVLIHIVWAKGMITPILTSAYAGGVPCCMATLDQPENWLILRPLQTNPVENLLAIAA